MKTFFTYIFLFSLLVLRTQGQSLHISATHFIGGDTNCYSTAKYAIPTRDNGVLFTGYTNCTGGGDIPPNPADTDIHLGYSNVLIGKLDSNLNIVWIKVYGGYSEDMGYAALQTPDGGYGILAYTLSNNRDVSGNHGAGDIWLLKLDSIGNLLWQKCYGSPADEQPISFALTKDNGFIILGNSNGAGGDVPTHYSGSEFDDDWVVIKTDSLGNKQWSKTIGGTDQEDFYGSILSVNNDYYLAGSSNSTDYDCGDTSWHSPRINTGYDYYLFKLDTIGNILWRKSYGSIGNEELRNAMYDSRDTSLIMAGETRGNDYMVSGNHGLGDIWVVKTGMDGTPKWTKCLGDKTEDWATNIIADNKKGYWVYGTLQPTSVPITGEIAQYDNWLFLIDSSGSTITNKIFGGTKDDLAASILIFKNGLLATGFSNSFSFTEGANYGPNIGAVNDDVFISRINYWPVDIDNLVDSAKKLVVYPNPSNGKISVKNPFLGAGSIQITSVVGINIYSRDFSSAVADIEIDTRKWAAGLYIIRWQSEDGQVLATKFINN